MKRRKTTPILGSNDAILNILVKTYKYHKRILKKKNILTFYFLEDLFVNSTHGMMNDLINNTNDCKDPDITCNS